MSSGMMETIPGGESDQYQSINPSNPPHTKEGGQMESSVSQNDTVESQQQAQKAERGEKTAENIRYGEALSEHGMGGETTGNSGRANQDSGYGSTSVQGDQSGIEDSRSVQGYGEGSGVGG